MKCLKANNRVVMIIILITGILGTVISSDWQAIGDDPCSMETSSNVFNQSQSFQQDNDFAEACSQQSNDCYWNPESVLTGQLCVLCREVCRSLSKTINIVQFSVGIVIIHLSALIGWTTIVGVATDCTGQGLQVSSQHLL